MGGGQNLGKNFGSHQTMEVHRVVDPSDTLQQIIVDNQTLKQSNQSMGEQLTVAIQQIQDLNNEMKELAKFRQVLQNPIEKLSVELYDSEQLRKIRGHMIQMFGQGGQMDAEGRWAQTVVNTRLQIVLRQLIFVGLQHWPQVKAQIDEIIKQQGLMQG